jgi:hypothetical protein
MYHELGREGLRADSGIWESGLGRRATQQSRLITAAWKLRDGASSARGTAAVFLSG